MSKLNVDALTVDSFTTGDSANMTMTGERCTGCDSTCGIIAPEFSDGCY
jgi:hypothetical protein